jgi:hypothetical protein
VPIVDHHDYVLLGEGHRIAFTLSEGPQDHKILHHATVPQLLLDGVCVVWASLLKESLEVVCRWSCLVLATTCGSHDTRHAGATHFLVVAVIAIDRSCDPLMPLLASLLATPGALFSALDANVRQHPLPLIGVTSLLPGA